MHFPSKMRPIETARQLMPQFRNIATSALPSKVDLPAA